MPSAPAMARSSGAVMKPRTRSAFAPTYAVVTTTLAMSLRGNCRTESERTAWSPAMRMTRLTTMARTGRLMKRSVSFRVVVAWLRGCEAVGATRPRNDAASQPPLRVFRFRRRAVARLHRVVDRHRGAGPQLEHARGHHFLARLDAGEHGDLVAARAAELHELLAHAAIALVRLRIGHVLDDVHRVAERRVRDGGSRQRHCRRLRSLRELRLDVHARAQHAGAVVEDGLHARIAGGLVDLRLERGDLSDLRRIERVGGHFDLRSGLEPPDLLLRDGEVDVRRPHRLQRHDGRSAAGVLAEVDLADAEDA